MSPSLWQFGGTLVRRRERVQGVEPIRVEGPGRGRPRRARLRVESPAVDGDGGASEEGVQRARQPVASDPASAPITPLGVSRKVEKR